MTDPKKEQKPPMLNSAELVVNASLQKQRQQKIKINDTDKSDFSKESDAKKQVS